MATIVDPSYAGLNLTGYGPCMFYTPDAGPWLATNPHILEHVNAGIQNGSLTHHPYLFALDSNNILRMYCAHPGAFLEAEQHLSAVLPSAFFDTAQHYLPNQRGYSPIGLLFSGAYVLWSHILMFGYLYYREDISIVPDTYFDCLCAMLVWRYEYSNGSALTGHTHERLFNLDGMRGGSVHEVDFPLLVQSAARLFVSRERVIGWPDGTPFGV